MLRSAGECGRAVEIVRVRSKCVTSLGLYTITACVYVSRQPPRSVALVARQSTLSDQQTDHPVALRLDGPCKRLRLSTLAITVYNTYHIEWGFTLLECILTCQNRRQGGRGSRLADWRRQRRIAPLRLFFANWPPSHSARAPVAMLRYTLLV